MNEDAKNIYQAALDGKIVQRLFPPIESEWNDRNPFQVLPNYSPREIPNCWRIKPEKKSERRLFRVYLNKETNLADIYNFGSRLSSIEFERTKKFGGWITVKLPYTVEVEQ